MPDGSWRTKLTREQKMGAGFLLIFGVLAIGFGWLQLHNTLYGPFVIHPTKSDNAVVYTDDKTKLQLIDTDHDGFNDYDELNFYRTSPYLSDTDSDGVEDKKEIDRGTDPLCPEGQVCNQSGSDAMPAVTSSTQIDLDASGVGSTLDSFQNKIGEVGPAEALLGDGTNTNSSAGMNLTAADVVAVSKDPKALRQLLLQTGQINLSDLNQIDDATLLTIANQIVASQSQTAQP